MKTKLNWVNLNSSEPRIIEDHVWTFGPSPCKLG
uniref:Uncharacterized protein n=1 Tax=Rhizophora mucronata TaxID=61149 RepID=A0A2P2IMC8_RHIMU